jgi:virulence factor Mce-like protein
MSGAPKKPSLERRRREQRAIWRAGVVLLVGSIVGTVLIFSGGLPFTGPETAKVEARFTDASNIRTGQKVRIRGIDIGKVTGVRGEAGGHTALVTMEVEPAKRRLLRSDAKAVAWWRTLLGRNFYIELEPGTRQAALGDGPIPPARTDHQFELDQLLTAFRPDAREGLQNTVEGLGEGMADAPAVKSTARALPPALRAIAKGIPPLRGRAPGDLGRVVTGGADVVSALAREERALGSLLENGNTAIGIVAAREADLEGLLRDAPESLQVTRTQLIRLDRTVDLLDPLVEDLRPNARRVRPTLDRLIPALDATTPVLARAQPLVQRLRPALRGLRDAARQGVPLIDELIPVLDRIRTSTIPYLEKPESDTKRPLYTIIGPTINEIGDSVSAYDAQGHMISFEGGISGRAGEGILPCTVLVTDPKEKLTCANLNALFAQLSGQQPPQQDPQDTPPATARKGR